MARGPIARLLGRRAPPPPEVQAALDALARLGEEHEELREGAAVQAALLRAAADGPALAFSCELAPAAAAQKLAAGTPLLRGEPVGLDEAALRDTMLRLALAAGRQGLEPAGPIAELIRRRALDPAELARAALAGDVAAISGQAAELAIDGELLGTLLRFSIFGPLVELAARLAPLREGRDWGQGYCPTCGGWPLLAEQRGLDLQRYLRCGLCASSWAADRLLCPFCGSRDHEQLASLQVEGEEQRRAATCDECRGYLKVLNSLTPIPPYQLPVHDLATLHLDMVALGRGYAPA